MNRNDVIEKMDEMLDILDDYLQNDYEKRNEILMNFENLMDEVENYKN